MFFISGGHRSSHGSAHHSGGAWYIGCLGLSEDELSEAWPYSGEPPKCEYTHHGSHSGSGSGGSSSNSGGSGSSGSSSGNSSSSGADGGGGGNSSNGDDENGDDENGDNSDYDDETGNQGGQDNEYNNGNGNAANQDDGNDNNAEGNGDVDNNNDGEYSDYGEENNDQGDDNDNGNGDGADQYDDGNGEENGDNEDEYNSGQNNNANNNDADGNGQDGRNKGDDYDADQTVTNEDFENVNEYYDEGNEDNDANDNGDGDDGADANGNDNANNNESGGDDYEEEYDPMMDFDIEQCDTYENLWQWDIILTCESQGDLSSCQCVFAEELFEQGRLECDDMSMCPTDCQICKSCMELLGCESPLVTSLESSRGLLVLVAIGLGVFVFGVMYYYRRGRSNHTSDLQEQLITGGDDPSTLSVPSAPQIWLAPDVPPAQFEPSAQAAFDASECSMDTSGSKKSVPVCPVSSIISRTEADEEQSSDEAIWLAPVI